jgi:hypothetical protein
LNYEAVLEDPKVLTKPYTMRSTLMLRERTRLREYSCVENNVDPQRYEKLNTVDVHEDTDRHSER